MPSAVCYSATLSFLSFFFFVLALNVFVYVHVGTCVYVCEILLDKSAKHGCPSLVIWGSPYSS